MKRLGLDVSALTDDQMLSLMADNPTLIRRPLLLEDGRLVVGFDRPAYRERWGDGV